jgi:hypothetical protein
MQVFVTPQLLEEDGQSQRRNSPLNVTPYCNSPQSRDDVPRRKSSGIINVKEKTPSEKIEIIH